ncbi:hypothetical protein H6G41_31610 [Tolypothrix sp. FACHB-123]|nr:hypothetical protein [Tolypothrix sp. FACHB-123]
MHEQSSAIKPLVNHLPLATYSQFLLSPENPAFSEPIIDNTNTNTEPEYINTRVTFLEFDPVDANEEITNSLDSQNIDNNPSELNNQSQSKAKKTKKKSSSQEKSKAKLKTTKKAKSSVKDKGDKQGNASSAVNQQINLSETDASASTDINLENNQAPTSLDNNIVVNANIGDGDAVKISPSTIFLDPPVGEDLAIEETPVFTDSAASTINAESGIIFDDENISENITRSQKNTTSQTQPNQEITSPSPVNNLTKISKNNIDKPVSKSASSDISVSKISPQKEVDNSANLSKKQALDNEHEAVSNSQLNADNIIAEQQEITSEDVNLSAVPEEIYHNIPVDLAPTPPKILNLLEPTEEVYVDGELNAENIIPNQPIVTSEAVNLADVSENAIARKYDVTSNLPVDLTPTPPVIAEAMNLDVRENAIAQKAENPNVPVELAPTPPVIADNLIVTAEGVNLDVSPNAIAQKAENPNIPVELAPTPPVIAEAVNLDVSPNAIAQKTESPSNIPVELTPTPPVIADNPIVTAEGVNLDVRENAIAQKSENPNIPVELTPTPPVIADNPIVAAEGVNVDVRENAIAQKTENPNVPVELTPTPPVIADNPIVTAEAMNVDVRENAIAQKAENPNVPVELAPTPPVIAEAVNFDVRENAIAQKTENSSNVPVELAPTPPVIAEAVNLDVSPNAIAQTAENSNIPVELTPTPPVIAEAVNLDVSPNAIAQKAENPNIPVELTPTPPVIAEAVNFDVRENAIAQKIENSNVPVELTPTPPIIADNPIVASQTLNLSDAPMSEVSALDNSQVNTDIPDGVTPPILGENTEIDPESVSKSTKFPFTQNQTQNLENLPAPQGFATGGQVTHSSVENPQIASSDTVPAMLTPGEFVINANDAQKNLHILRHINTGGAAEDVILPSLEIPTPKNPTKVDSFSDTSLQRHPTNEESHTLTPGSLGTEISQQRLSPHHSLQLSNVDNQATAANPPSPHYSLPTLIFRKPSVNNNTAYETPNQWSTVEELMNGSNDPFTFFNLNSEGESNWQNSSDSQSSQSSSSPPQVLTKRLSLQGFANGGEVQAPDIATDIAPITETIQNPSVANPAADESENLEALAYEIYNRLRQRIEVERERQGIYLGRLPW